MQQHFQHFNFHRNKKHIISMNAVYILCFFLVGFILVYLLKKLYPIEVEKIPMIIDRFLKLYRGSPRGEEEIYAKDSASCWVEKSCEVCLKLVVKLMKAVHHMTLYWNEYISFAIVSHYCFLDKVFIPLKFRKE